MIQCLPRSTPPAQLFPNPTLFRSLRPLEYRCPLPPHIVSVMASLLMGRTSLVHLRSLVLPEGAPHFHARVPGRFLPPEKQRLAVALDRAQTFVFPRSPASLGG